MKLGQLLKDIEYDLIQGDLGIEVNDLSYDSRQVDEVTAFVALKGIDTDGHLYISQAIDRGCKCIIICENISNDIMTNNREVTFVKVKDTRRDLSYLSANLFGHPANNLIKIGITGTKGKTTTAYMIKNILETAGYKVGVIGTVGTIIDGKLYEHKNTTPESYYIQKYLRQMVDTNTEYVIMEVSSQALKVGRVSNIIFDYAIFTNLSIDHIGKREHPTFEDYVYSKSLLFKQAKVGILNKDDEHYEEMFEGSTSHNFTYGKEGNDLVLKDVTYYKDEKMLGISLKTIDKMKISKSKDTNEDERIINKDMGRGEEFLVPAPGLFSAYNAMSAILLATLLNIDMRDIKKGLETFKVPGRCEIYNLKDNVKVIIDYAHNKVSMESIIKTIKDYKSGRVITVFGCGGGRSFERRYELGEMSGKYADLSIVTMDNPRHDDIKLINKDIVKGIEDVGGVYKVIEDREEAIRYAISVAKKQDVILLLGKGHEKFQQVGDKVMSFDEEKIVREYL